MEPLDQQVVTLAKAIRQTESGGDFNAKGKSGEHGGYQFTEPTWNAVSSKYGIKVPLAQATPQQQNEVVYKRIKEWKDKGMNVGQIASMWNAGEGEPEAHTGKFGSTTPTHKAGDPSTGVNSYGAKYNVPEYAKSIAAAYQKLKQGQQVSLDPNNPSSVGNQSLTDRLKSGNAAQLTNEKITPTGVAKAVGSIGPAISKLVQGYGNAITGGGTDTLGKSLGTNLGFYYEKLKGKLGGKDNSQYYDTSQPSVGETVKAGAKVGGAIASIIGAGKIAGSLTGAGRTAANKLIEKQALENSLTPSNAGLAGKVDAFSAVLKDPSLLPHERVVLEQALNQAKSGLLNPNAAMLNLLKYGSKAAKLGLYGLLGWNLVSPRGFLNSRNQ